MPALAWHLALCAMLITKSNTPMELIGHRPDGVVLYRGQSAMAVSTVPAGSELLTP